MTVVLSVINCVNKSRERIEYVLAYFLTHKISLWETVVREFLWGQPAWVYAHLSRINEGFSVVKLVLVPTSASKPWTGAMLNLYRILPFINYIKRRNPTYLLKGRLCTSGNYLFKRALFCTLTTTSVVTGSCRCFTCTTLSFIIPNYGPYKNVYLKWH